MGRKQYFTLDGMRGIAALAVVLFHSEKLIGAQLAPSGYLAVDLFFVLSGFVIAHAYEAKLTAGMGALTFLKARLLRFYPLYALGLVLGLGKCLAVVVMGMDSDMAAWAILPAFGLGLLFLPAPLVGPDYNLFPLNIPVWSLFFELIVNTAYALLVRRLTNAALWLVLAASGAMLAISVGHAGRADLGAWGSQFGAGLVRTVFSFTAGVLIYRYRELVRIPLPPVLTLLAVGGLLLVGPPAQYRAFYDLMVIGFASPLLVMMGASAQPGGKLAKGFAYLGVISFPIYAVHHPLIRLARGVEGAVLKGYGPELAGLLFIGLIVGGGILDRFYDRPVRKWLETRKAPQAIAI